MLGNHLPVCALHVNNSQERSISVTHHLMMYYVTVTKEVIESGLFIHRVGSHPLIENNPSPGNYAQNAHNWGRKKKKKSVGEICPLPIHILFECCLRPVAHQRQFFLERHLSSL